MIVRGGIASDMGCAGNLLRANVFPIGTEGGEWCGSWLG